MPRRSASLRPCTAAPSTTISPASGCSRPSSSRTVVVLPEPDSPTRAWVVPAATVNETSSTTVRDVPSTVKLLLTARTSIRGAAAPEGTSTRPDRYRSGFSAGASPCSCTVYGDSGLSKTSAVRPASCTRPSLSTTISSVRSAAIARSCVISSRLMPSEDCSSLSRSRMRFWIVTSSALVGSSATRSFGCGSTASPMSTRCSIPPESWCG